MLRIIRGLPGSGKSTFARTFKDCMYAENDFFHINELGEYHYSRENIGYAIEYCRGTTALFLNKKINVVVANTFTLLDEVREYVEMAEHFHPGVEIYRMTTQYKDTHDVPQNVFEAMKKRMIDIPGECLVPNLKVHDFEGAALWVMTKY